VIGASLADEKGRSINTHKHMDFHSLVERRNGEHVDCRVRVAPAVFVTVNCTLFGLLLRRAVIGYAVLLCV
jgi:hypothetical protein